MSLQRIRVDYRYGLNKIYTIEDMREQSKVLHLIENIRFKIFRKNWERFCN